MSEFHHIPSAKFLWIIAAVLFFLTFITVGVTWIQIPEPWNVIVAISIAVVKTFFVVAFFMHLWWDSKFNILLLITGIVFFILLVGFTLLDTLFRLDPIPTF